jgi:hypothetical protein
MTASQTSSADAMRAAPNAARTAHLPAETTRAHSGRSRSSSDRLRMRETKSRSNAYTTSPSVDTYVFEWMQGQHTQSLAPRSSFEGSDDVEQGLLQLHALLGWRAGALAGWPAPAIQSCVRSVLLRTSRCARESYARALRAASASASRTPARAATCPTVTRPPSAVMADSTASRCAGSRRLLWTPSSLRSASRGFGGGPEAGAPRAVAQGSMRRACLRGLGSSGQRGRCATGAGTLRRQARQGPQLHDVGRPAFALLLRASCMLALRQRPVRLQRAQRAEGAQGAQRGSECAQLTASSPHA